MRYAQIRKMDIANGEGIRVSIFVTGCTHKCRACFNGAYQDFSFGETWTDETSKTVIDFLKNDVITGLTILGGEPMQNLELIEVVRRIKEDVDKNIWIYSGYTFEQIIADPLKLDLLKECDVLVDGLFVQELLDLKLRFRGSSNQRIIDIRKSLDKGEACLYEFKHN